MRLMSVYLFPTHVQLMIVSLDHSTTSGCIVLHLLEVRGPLGRMRIWGRRIGKLVFFWYLRGVGVVEALWANVVGHLRSAIRIITMTVAFSSRSTVQQ